jgi:PAS domain S-box-containing protein
MTIKKKIKNEDKSPDASESTLSIPDNCKKPGDSSSARSALKEKTAEELIHDLQVHQIELETQSEELRRSHQALAESRDQYLDLYEFAPLGYLTLNETALISRSNLTAAILLGTDRSKLIQARLRKFVIPEDRETWDRYFMCLLKSDEKITATLSLRRGDSSTFPARLESIRLTGDKGQFIRVAISDISDMRKAELELKQSEERFRLALRNAPVSVAIQDKDLVFQWAYNPYASHPADIKGMRDTDLFTPEDAANLIKLKRKVFETGEEVREQIWLTMNGERTYLDLYLEPQRDDTGLITGIGVATVDLTRQELSDAMLKRTLSLLNAALEATADAIYVVDNEGKITGYNQKFMIMWNIPPAVLESGVNETVQNHILPQIKDPIRFMSSIRELQVNPARESSDRVEFKDGKIFERYSKPQKIGDMIVGRVWSFRDVTERKRAEEAQIASEIRYRRLFEMAQDGILILDAETGQIMEVNPFLINMLGFSRDQFLGKKLWEIGLFKDIVANKENFEELQRKEYVRYEDMPLETADRQRIAVEFISSVYEVNNKRVVQCNIRDITQRKKLEEDLVIKAEELARSNIELQQFAYIASHDLQEPLRAISGFAELLVKRYHGKIDEKADTYIDFITEGTTRMQQMIQDLLSYSRVQTQVHEFVLIDSNTALDLAISDLQVAAREHHAVITRDPLPSVYADLEQITKMFQNLISNAIKFHKPGMIPTVHISAKQDEKSWIFSVSDNGIGIDRKYADRVFKIFQRLHTRDEYPGTGIGLAICKRIAEQHGGTIWIESVPGTGSQFYFTIPKRKKETRYEG